MGRRYTFQWKLTEIERSLGCATETLCSQGTASWGVGVRWGLMILGTN
jgi:hypothetical protein